jgi:hypothetical protein
MWQYEITSLNATPAPLEDEPRTDTLDEDDLNE